MKMGAYSTSGGTRAHIARCPRFRSCYLREGGNFHVSFIFVVGEPIEQKITSAGRGARKEKFRFLISKENIELPSRGKIIPL